MTYVFSSTVGLTADGVHVPAGMTAVRFLLALMATRGAATRFAA